VYVRRYDDAIAAARAARRLQPDAPVARGALYEALIMKGLDDEALALEWLERAYEDGDGNMPYIGMPIYDPLRADLRFQDLLRRMNLPQ